MRVISWNLNGAVDDRARAQAAWLASQQPDVALVQEIAPRMVDSYADWVGLPTMRVGVRSGDGPSRPTAVLTKLGVVGDWLSLDAVAFPQVAVGVAVAVDGQSVEVWSYHAPNGRKYTLEKVHHAHALARRLRDRSRPVLVGADLNTPAVDPVEDDRVQTHWHTGAPGLGGQPGDDVLCGPPDVRVHALDDALRVLRREAPQDAPPLPAGPQGPLAISYAGVTLRGEPQRYDAVWVSPEVSVVRVTYATDATLRQGMSDHAAVAVDVDISAG